MGTPFCTFLGPSNLDAYDSKLYSSQQPESIPKTFLDAMEVREEVFVKEQGVPLENEFDSDDARACHWVNRLPLVPSTGTNEHAGCLCIRQ